MRKFAYVLAFSLILAVPLRAQQVSGQGTCGEPEVAQEVPVGDRPDHSYSINKSPCSWIKPFVIAGEQAVGGTAVQISERAAGRQHFRGHYLDRMSGGDTVHYTFEGTTTFQDQMPRSQSWSWTIVGGSGKFKALSGKGSCKGAWPEGKSRWTCSGSYRLPK